jgi:hypothetical protein
MRNLHLTQYPGISWRTTLIRWVLTVAMVLSLCGLSASVTHAALDENCTANLLNRSAQVDSSGGFGVGNIPWEAGYFRVRVICKDGDTTVRGASPFVQLRQFVVTPIETISFDAVDPQSAMGRGA